MRVGCLDIGTNSVRLLIADTYKHGIKRIYKGLITTRLGTGVDLTGALNIDAINRTVDAISEFIDKCNSYGCKKIMAIATSAVRDARNRDELLERIYDNTGIDVEVISGKEEAILSYKGVLYGFKKHRDNLIIIDIGGGSTEITFGNNVGIKMSKSVNIGAVRLTERHFKGKLNAGIITTDILHNMYCDIEKNLDALREFKGVSADSMVMTAGVGGTITSLAAIDQEMEYYDPDKIHNYNLTFKKVSSILLLLSQKSLAERKMVKGLMPERADVIVAGNAILVKLMEFLGVEDVYVSEWDNLEGLIFERILDKM